MSDSNKEVSASVNSEKLRRSEENYRNIFNSTNNGIFLYNKKTGVIIDVNLAAVNMYGYSKEELMKMRAGTLGTGDRSFSRKAAAEWIKKTKDSGTEVFEWLAKHKDGTKFWIEVELKTVLFNGEETIISVERNINEQKIAEQKLRESESSYRDLFNNAIDAIYIQNMKGEFIDINKGAVKMYGYSENELIGKTPEFLSAPDKNDLDAVGRAHTLASGGEPQQFEFWGKRKNGEIFPKLVRLSKGTFFGENVIFAFALDLSERKRAEAERQAMEEQMLRSQKLESLGFLAGGIAHDFNNLLTGILGNAGLVRMDMDGDNIKLKNIKYIEDTAMKAADLCSQLLAYSGKGKIVILPVDINSVIMEITKLLETSLSKKISLDMELADEVLTMEVDTSQLRQLIINLILNAADSIGNNKGEITIRTGSVKEIKPDKSAMMFLQENIKKGEYVCLEIKDDGEGIEEKIIERIFDPFFTTRTGGKGLGLSAVIGIVKSHKGIIQLSSTQGKGSSFKVFIPASEKNPMAGVKTGLDIQHWTAGGIVLVADDESLIRKTIKNTLEKFGFKVITARDGNEAVKKFKKYKEEIILLFLDLTMPGKDGVEAMKEISGICTGTKAILSSGYNKNDAIENFAQLGFSEFLPKPYPPEKLIEVVMRVLEKSRK